MLDPAKSTTDPETTLAGQNSPPPEAESTPAPEEFAGWTVGDDSSYTIRLAKSPGTCAVCREDTGVGPVGYLDESPICDLCLLEGSTDLGMIIALVSVVRAFATVRSDGSPDHQEALKELNLFARLFHQIASKSWPARLFRLPNSILGPGGEGS